MLVLLFALLDGLPSGLLPKLRLLTLDTELLILNLQQVVEGCIRKL